MNKTVLTFDRVLWCDLNQTEWGQNEPNRTSCRDIEQDCIVSCCTGPLCIAFHYSDSSWNCCHHFWMSTLILFCNIQDKKHYYVKPQSILCRSEWHAGDSIAQWRRTVICDTVLFAFYRIVTHFIMWINNSAVQNWFFHYFSCYLIQVFYQSSWPNRKPLLNTYRFGSCCRFSSHSQSKQRSDDANGTDNWMAGWSTLH